MNLKGSILKDTLKAKIIIFWPESTKGGLWKSRKVINKYQLVDGTKRSELQREGRYGPVL